MDLLKARPICGTYGRYWQLYEQRANAYNVTATEWANHIHDGVWSLTQALHQTLLHNPSLNLSRHHRGDINTTALIRSKVEALNFTGVSRQIVYNASTGYSTRAVNVFQAGDALARHVGSYHPPPRPSAASQLLQPLLTLLLPRAASQCSGLAGWPLHHPHTPPAHARGRSARPHPRLPREEASQGLVSASGPPGVCRVLRAGRGHSLPRVEGPPYQ